MVSPVISPDLLAKYNGQLKSFAAREFIFSEEEEALFYFQLEEGLVKMLSIEEHRDRLHNFFLPGDSFGEPPLLNGFHYPAYAIASSPCLIWMVPKEDFLALLYHEPKAHLRLTQKLAHRLQYKNLIMRIAVNHTPSEQILALLNYYQNIANPNKAFYVPFTRQEIADMLGLRVETVIRACLKLVKNGNLHKNNRQLVVPVKPQKGSKIECL